VSKYGRLTVWFCAKMSGLKVGKAFLQFLSYKSKEQIMQILEVDFYEPMGMEVSQSV
jgi:hypothetical protein